MLDVRFKRINYNPSVVEKIYERMVSERQQIASRFRSEGEGAAAKIIGDKDHDLNMIQSEAYQASHVVGRKVIALGEVLVAQIPVVKTIYATSKQIIELFQGRSETQSQKVVLVEFPTPGLKAFGFLTGHITMPDATECYKVFIPTAPNPTSGYFQLVPVDRCEILDMSSEQALRLIISVGILAPPNLQASATESMPAYVPVEVTADMSSSASG